MNLRTRLTVNFLTQVFLLFSIVCCLGLALAVFAMRELNEGHHTDAVLLVGAMPSATTVGARGPTVATWLLNDVNAAHGWVQILNSQGREVYSFHRPSQIPTSYAPGLLVEYRTYPERIGYTLYSWYDTRQGRHFTWLLGIPYTSTTRLRLMAPYAVAVFMLFSSIVVTVILALVFGRRLGGPLLHMMLWIERLAEGAYDEPTDGRGRLRSRTASGGLRRSFRLYREVLAALDELSSVLKEAQVSRTRLEATREEWITGVSHDLKTPLSSVKGYGDLLAEAQYEWSREEINHFGQVIVNKALHMEELIEDLGLAFRLRNHALPLARQICNVVEVVRRTVIDLVNRPGVNHQQVTFQSDVEALTYPLDPAWFSRALDNLLTNAVLHNPPDTPIHVYVRVPQSAADWSAVRIDIADSGTGMDAETLQHLFDRYYRGTNTSAQHSKGSGLGCAIAKQLIEAHGGRVTATSEIGQGTTFRIALPREPVDG